MLFHFLLEKDLLHALLISRPRAFANGGGTALPICLYLSLMLP